jgi:mannose-6-phosphate isomerase-like protein (cupin superfamily)
VNDRHPTVLLRGEDSDGVLTMTEETVPAGWEGPPLHWREFDQAYYVVEGELTIQRGDELATASGGQLAFARSGVPHTFANLGEAPARYVLLSTPAAFNREPVPEVTPMGPRIGERSDLPPARPLETVPGGVRVLVRGADSDGRVAIMDNTVPAGVKGPPFHHHEFDEAFYVLDGELTFRLGDELVTRGAGELVFAPGGAQHTFANRSAAEARMLLVCTPAGFERYFQRMAAREAGVEPPREALEPWPEVTVVGPQIEDWLSDTST